MSVASRRAASNRWFIAFLIAMLGALSAGSAASASTYPPPDPILSLSNRQVPPSTPFEATVTGAQPGEEVTFYLVGNDPITVLAGPDGIATVTLISPPTPGPYDVTAVLATTGVTLIDAITVAVVAPTTPTIPRTGSDGVSTMALLGGGFVVLGGAFLLVSRLRRRDTTPALV